MGDEEFARHQKLKANLGDNIENDPNLFWQIIDPEVELDEVDENYIAHLSYRKVKKH